MAEHVEARSLAELNYLAANPPQYPTNPAEKKQDPVVLYISRVPGTRDLILSPFKPQVKNVTADDVASSLYYVHLDTPEDELLVPPEQAKDSSSPRSSSESRRTKIQRKPLPATANLSDIKDVLVDPATHTLHPALRPGNQIQDFELQQPQPVSHRDPAFLSPQKPVGPQAGPVQRKPVGPRAIVTGMTTDTSPPAPGPSNPPPLPPRENIQNMPAPADLHTPISPSRSPNRAFRSPSPFKRQFKPFQLTLIRRDRSSDEQWNVGKISCFQVDTPEQIVDDRHFHSPPNILINLETSGYAKFRGMPTRPSLGGGGGDIRQSLDFRPHSSSGANSIARMGEELLHHNPHGGFQREVKMGYSPSLASNIRQVFRGRRKSNASPTSPGPPISQNHGRHHSAASVRSFGGDFDAGNGAGGGETSIVTQPAPGLKPRGYVFESPWGGRCEFQTGNAGRSLRCRHVLPNFTGNVFNPLVDGADGDNRGGGGGGGNSGSSHKKAQPISELRFNLPSSEVLFNKDNSGSPRAKDQIQGQFQRLLNGGGRKGERGAGGGDGGAGAGVAYHYSEDEDDYDGDGARQLDMSLGREKAGGGNRGSRAKMGKLIIAPDGLKMLDLVVAANVAVWWTSWERTFGEESTAATIS